MQKIRDWRQPHNFHDVQRFLGLVQYPAHFLPDITAYTTPLSLCTRNGKPFIWMPLLDKCFESIKSLTCRAPVLKPIDPKTLRPSGYYATAPRLESALSTVKDQTGSHAAPWASYPRSSSLLSRTIALMNMRRSPSSKHL